MNRKRGLWAGLTAMAIAATVVTTASAYTTKPILLANAGGPAIGYAMGCTNPSNCRGYLSGTAIRNYTPGRTIIGAKDEATAELYRDLLKGTFTFSIPVPRGNYYVHSGFAELYDNPVGARSINMTSEGTRRISGLDVVKEVGNGRILVKTKRIRVTDGVLNLTYSGNTPKGAILNLLYIEREFADPTTTPPTTVGNTTTTSTTTSTTTTSTTTTSTTTSTTTTAPGGSVVIAGAGDIAGGDGYEDDTARLMQQINPRFAFTLGDNWYDSNVSGYNATWGAFKAKTKPTPGNHDYDAPEEYYDYFSVPEYYSWSVNGWRIYALNSEIDTDESSAQYRWLQQQLATNPACSIAMWHKPRWSSGDHGNEEGMDAIWSLLANKNNDLVLAGHEHNYERFSAINGMVSMIVGTGGKDIRYFGTTQAGSVKRDTSGSHGVMKLTLNASSFNFEYVPIAGDSFRDSGSGTCR